MEPLVCTSSSSTSTFPQTNFVTSIYIVTGGWLHAESIGWFIEEQAFLRWYHLAPPPPPPLPFSSQQVVSLSVFLCMVGRAYWLWGGARGWGRSQIIRPPRERLVLYKSFNSLWVHGREHWMIYDLVPPPLPHRVSKINRRKQEDWESEKAWSSYIIKYSLVHGRGGSHLTLVDIKKWSSKMW